MSTNIQNNTEEAKRIVAIDFDAVPKILGITTYRKTPHISQPEKVELFNNLFDDLYKYCEKLEGEFHLDRSRDYAFYFQMMFEFARPKMQNMYDEHRDDFERMIMHVSKDMIDDKRRFLSFFLFQMFMLEKGTKRNLTLTQRLLATQSMQDIDFREVHDNLRQDAQNLLFLASSYSCTFITPHPDNLIIGPAIPGRKRFVGTRRTWDTKKMLARAVPMYAESLKLQEQLDAHIDHVLTKDKEDKAMGAMFYYLIELQPTDMPEIMAFMGNFVTFDIPESINPYEKYFVTINRTIKKREMDFFKSLLAATHLACYPGIMKILSATPYLYLWGHLLDENPAMRKNVESRPLSQEGKFFRELFDEEDLASILKSEREGVQKGKKVSNPKEEKYILPRNFHTFSDIDLENKRAEVNARITDIMNGKIEVRDPTKEIERLNGYVLELSRCISGRVSSVWSHDFLSLADVQQQEKERAKAAHREKRIELDTTLVGLELHDREQPGHIDCSLILMTGYPAGSLVSVLRKMPGQKDYTLIYQDMPLPDDGMIPITPEVLQHNGKISYRVTFTSPEGREFEPNQTTKNITLESNHLSKSAEKVTEKPKIIELSPEELEAESLKETLLILQTYETDYEREGAYNDGKVTIVLDDKHISDKRKILSPHRQWTISDTGEISPAFDGPEKAMILSLADKIRVRVKRENEEKKEKNKEAQSLSTAFIVLSEYGDFYEQEGKYADGVVTIHLKNEHIEQILSVVGEKGFEVRAGHREWHITDRGDISPIIEAEERVPLLNLAEKIRERIRREQREVEENKKLEFIAAIDAEFQILGFSLSDALDNSDLKLALNQKIDTFRRKKKNSEIEWTSEVSKLSPTCREKGYRFFTARYDNGFPLSITLSKVEGWSAVLTLQPTISFKITNPPQKDTQIFRQRIENALLTFAYSIMKNGDGTLSALDQDTRAQEDLIKLKRDYRRDLRKKKARIIIQKIDGTFLIIRNISRDNLEQELGQAQSMHGQGNVALLLRESTYHFHGEHGVIRPGIDKIRDAYESFSDPEVGAERRDILRQRIIKTLADQNILKNITVNGCKRDGFIPGSGVDQILSKMVEGFQGKELIEGNIDDAFLNAFIEKLKLGSSPVPVSYVNHRVAYCRPDDIAGLIAD